jgi:hypothetical protein
MSPVKFPPPPPPHASEKNSSSKKQSEDPPLSTADRRNTNSSLATINSNTELGKIEDEDTIKGNRSSTGSLRDRFKFLRMREEAGITIDEAGEPGQPTGLGIGLSSPSSAAGDEPTSPLPPTLAKQSTVNPNLAPGTAAGFAAGPAVDTTEPVDWDLWQNVVNEGPAAVARTSAEELNRAIASGIPQAIRGVIWQVLSQSKNEDLEDLYKELVARGTGKETTKVKTPQLLNGSDSKEKESIASSSSSVHSDYSTPATTTGSAPLGSPSLPSDNHDDMAKLQLKLAAEKQKSTKQEIAAIQKLEKNIKRDLGARTSYSKYLMAAGLQDGLFGICKAYALYDEAVGYAQGMNFIAMPLLFNMPEEEAFSLFVTLMNKYGLRDLFVQDMPGLHLHLYQFERLLEDLEPALYCHLRRKEVKPQLYATQWFLTLFAYRFPLQLVLRIYDLILSEGLETAILKFGIVLMQKNAEALMGMKDMGALTTFLKEKIFDVYIDKAPSASSILESGFFGSTGGIDKEVYRADVLVRDAVSVNLTPEMVKQYTTEWKEQQRVEKDRETELQGLKDKTAMLETKVRTLERRAEQSDTEHVQVASELIKTKVENDTLAEENETLKTKVEELQRIVDTQPEEVEARMRTEMDTVMQKNISVHNENRMLEENMAEMEKDLVDTKMKYADVSITDFRSAYSVLMTSLDQPAVRAAQAEVEQRHTDDDAVTGLRPCICLYSSATLHYLDRRTSAYQHCNLAFNTNLSKRRPPLTLVLHVHITAVPAPAGKAPHFLTLPHAHGRRSICIQHASHHIPTAECGETLPWCFVAFLCASALFWILSVHSFGRLGWRTLGKRPTHIPDSGDSRVVCSRSFFSL